MLSTEKNTGVHQSESAVRQGVTLLTPDDLAPFVIAGMASGLADDLTVDLPVPVAKAEFPAKVPNRSDRSTMVQLEKSIQSSVAHSTSFEGVMPEKVDVLGVEVSVTTYEDLIRLFIAAARRRDAMTATFMAVHAVVTAALDPSYRYRINAFDVVGPDGQPVRWAMNLLHKIGLKERVCGPFMMERLSLAPLMRVWESISMAAPRKRSICLKKILKADFPQFESSGWNLHLSAS